MKLFGNKKEKQTGKVPVSKPELTDVQKKTTNEKRSFTDGLVSVKDIIAPSSLEVDFNHVQIDNKYYRTLFVVGYPRFVGMNWLSYLINFDVALSLSMYIYPTDGKAILDDLRRKITEMEAEISTDIQRGRLVNPGTQAKLEDALNLQADLVKGEERFFQFGLYITIVADSREELDKINKGLEAALGSLLVVTKRATLQMEDGFVTGLPLGQDRLSVTRNMDTTSLATTFPFVSSDLSDDKGVVYGINSHNGSLIIFDRFSMPNYNSVVFATAGAGKSYMIKLEVLRSLMLGTEIIIIDPENEYRDLANSVGGQYIAFGYGEDSKINPFDLSLVEEQGENALNSKILTVHKLMRVMLGELDPIEESVLDKAMMDAYKMKGITPDPETQKKEPPLIEDLYKSLIGMEDEKSRLLAARLEKYIKGSFSGIFNQKTTVNLTNPFVVFGIKNLEETLRPVAMHIILDYIWTVVKGSLKRRILVVDEAWYLMQYEDSASFLRGIVKRGRKYYLGVTTITQDVDDFLETPYGKEIVTNSAIQILLKQHTAAIDLIGEVFYLSQGEKQLLLTASKGQGIFFAGQNHVAIEVISSEEEHQLITSNPEDILKNRSAKPLVKTDEKLKEVDKDITNTPLPSKVNNLNIEKKEDKPLAENQKIESNNKTDSLLDKTEPEIKKEELETKPPINEDIDVTLERKISDLEALENNKPNENKKEGNLFQNDTPLKNPNLPPLPKFEPLKTEVVNPDNNQKPIFVKTEEVKIPQPQQLVKKPQPVFDSPSPKVMEEQRNKPVEEKKEDGDKKDYDDLFGNGIV